jgi:electron transfer flavoprotein beta subunit
VKLLVCVKQVPDSTVRVKVAADGKGIATDGVTWAISPYDEYAVEMALERKDADASTTVSVVTLGPPRARDALRQALAMGCDDATLVTGAGAETLGGLAVARALAKIVLEAKPDVVLCGKQASDDEQGFVGQALAETLGWPHVAIVTKFAPAGDATEIWKESEGGHEVWKATGPVVLTIQKSEREPRYPSLPGIMKAKRKEIPERDLASLGADLGGPRVEILEMEPPPARKAGRVMKDGDTRAMAAELAKLLRDEAKVV